MGCAVLKMPLPFTLHIRCENCMRESQKAVEVPEGEGAPRDVDEFMESGLIGSLSFHCRPCGSVIGQIIGIEGGGRHGY